MQARVTALRSLPLPDGDLPPWSGIEPEELEDAARSLCAARPGSPAAERLMERASYLRAIRSSHPAGRQAASALLLA